MITCAECLTIVSTGSHGEMQAATEVGSHCATCAHCARVVTDVRQRENTVASTLAQLQMVIPSSLVAETAIAGAGVDERRLTAVLLRAGLIAALVITAWIGTVNELIPAFRRTFPTRFDTQTVTETISLKCISPQQALDLATPYLRSKAAIYTSQGLPVVTIRGIRREFVKAKAAIEEFDIKCQLPRATTTRP